jgi:hypothetical protein
MTIKIRLFSLWTAYSTFKSCYLLLFTTGAIFSCLIMLCYVERATHLCSATLDDFCCICDEWLSAASWTTIGGDSCWRFVCVCVCVCVRVCVRVRVPATYENNLR